MLTTTQSALALAVPKQTGTHGDALIAWGLAIFVSELLGDKKVMLSDNEYAFRIEARVTDADLVRAIAGFSFPRARSRLKWLESQQNKRIAPPQIGAGFKVDRDELRDAYRLWRENMRAMKPQADGGEPVITASADTQLYPFYEVLTNPGTQWAGYNSFVERLYAALTPDGVRALLAQYGAFGAVESVERPSAKRGAKPPMFNPPGFMYPGMNKGPTMRVTDTRDVTVGSASAADWTLADRGDRTLFENYLAYIGYFQVARIVTTKERRVVVAPIPERVALPGVLNAISSVAQGDGLRRELEASDLTEYLAAQNALDYGEASLMYLAALQGGEEGASELRAGGMAFKGVYLSVYWRPNGNVFAPSRMTRVALPVWLPRVRQLSVDLAMETLKQHRARLRSVRGKPWEENRLSSEQRTAIEEYLLSLNGDQIAWFHAVAAWFPAARAAARANWRIGLWSSEEVRRIALAMSTQDQQGQQQESLTTLLDAPEFKRLASTIRLSTVVPHIAREARRKNQALEASPWDIRYELPTRLRQAAERGHQEFLREFYAFIAAYNDETARPKTGRGRPLARTDDLQWLSAQLDDPKLRKILPAALLAFGTSLRGKAAGTGSTGDADSTTKNPDGTPNDQDVPGGEE